jgi:hypothetical protein
MTYGLLKPGAATVLVGDGHWTNSYEIDALSCGRTIRAVDICQPGDASVLDRAGFGYKIVPFAVVGEQVLGVRCSPEESKTAMDTAMADASEYVVAGQFWTGDVTDWAGVDEGMFLEHADIVTVSAGANTGASVTKALIKAYQLHPEITPMVHMGIGAAASFADNFLTSHAGDDIKWVISPGYPDNGIAVTGPVVVHLGSVETIVATDQSINKKFLSGTRLASVEFDPCLAVRVA